MLRDPVLIPPRGGVYALVDKTNQRVLVSYSSNMQYRSYVLAKEIFRMKCSALALTPDQDPQPQFTFMVITELNNRDKDACDAAVFETTSNFEKAGFTVINRSRTVAHAVEIDGQTFALSGALAYIERTYPDVKLPAYNTAWQRLERGLTPRQVVGLDPLPPRWGRRKKLGADDAENGMRGMK